MALSPLGIFSAAGAGGAPQTFELIQTHILGSTASSITFSNLANFSSTYRHLQIRTVSQLTGTVWNELQFNGDTGNNYARHELRGNGSTVTSFGTANFNTLLYGIGGTNFGAQIIDILDAYSTTKNKTIRTFAGTTLPSDGVQLTSGVYLSTNALTSLRLFTTSTWSVGSRFSLYGIRG